MSTLSTASCVRGALLALAIGDALGAPGEFSGAAQVHARWGRITDYVKSGTWDKGEWTDDTAMALHVAHGITAVRNGDPVPAVGAGFLLWYRSQPKDVGSTIRGVLGAKNDAVTWVRASQSSPAAQEGKAGGNGSLMRTLPVALAYVDEARMLNESARISAMTHWDAHAEACCAVYCLWVRNLLAEQERLPAWETAVAQARELAPAFPGTGETPGMAAPAPVTYPPLLRGGEPVPFWQFLETIPSRAVADLQPSGYAGYSVECLEAAVGYVLHAESLEELLIATANMGGESDTVGAVAGGAAGAYWGEASIPLRWLTGLKERTAIEGAADLLLAHRAAYSDSDNNSEAMREASEALYASEPELPPFAYRAIGDTRLWHGRNPLTAWDIKRLKADGITHVLDLRHPTEWGDDSASLGGEAVAAIARPETGIMRHHINIAGTHAPANANLDDAVAFIENSLSDPDARVYVHCRLGRERTGSVLAAYYGKTHGVTARAAVTELNHLGAVIAPNSGQLAAAEQWLRNRER